MTDEQLAMLTTAALALEANDLPYYIEVKQARNWIRTMRARLEAAEAVCRVVEPTTVPLLDLSRALGAWRAAKGDKT